MSRRGDIVWENVSFLILLAIAIIPLAIFINKQSNAAYFYEDFYSKEIANIINNAESGMEFKIDITPLARSASKNGKEVSIDIDNVNNIIRISARTGAATEFGFLKDLDIVEWEVKSLSGNFESTRFIFKTKEGQKNEL